MKKVVTFILFFLSFVINAYASSGTVICTNGDTSKLQIRDAVAGNSLGGISCNTSVEVLDENVGPGGSCNNWYKIQYGDIIGYSCGEYISINKELTNLVGKVSCVENDDPLTVRDVIGGTITDRLSCDTKMNIINNNAGSTDKCSNWYKVSYGNNKEGYVCGNYVITEIEIDYEDENIIAYRDSLKSAGFPDSYLEDLIKMHIEHPNWNFVAYDTNLDWEDAIENESVQGRSLIYYSYGEGYRSLESYSYNYETDEYYRHPTEKNWWYASPEAISYYMDPRNYLNSKNIFTFETLSYVSSFQTSAVVDKMLGNSFMPTIYSKFSTEYYTVAFMDAAEDYQVSPIHLASRILQEQGTDGGTASLGEEFSYDGKKYSNIFNFYNIKATGADPAIQGLVWAMGGVSGTGTSYNRPWNTPYKSITGGASFLSNDYISIGQDTLYFQKFDIISSGGYFNHQYMQNITAPLTEGISTHDTYAGVSGLLNETFEFIIPVYDNMPEEKVEAPKNENSNSYLKTIKIDNTEIEGFKYNKTNYELDVAPGTKSINISATTINSNATVSGIGEITLEKGANEIKIVSTAQNKKTTTYTLIINRQESEENIEIEENKKLKSLTVDKIDFDFNEETLTYNLNADYNIDKITITYELEDQNGIEKFTKESSLIIGSNTINIEISLAEEETKTYALIITRKEPSISYLLNNSGVKYDDSYLFGIKLNTSIESIINNIKDINNSTVITVKDKNNNTKNTTFATGDKVILRTGLEEKTFEVLIRGDVNSDGTIDKLDALAVLRQFYNYTEYEGVYKKATDADNNGKYDKLDALAILRDYYGYEKIEE